jgi:F-type H+-transporting ATPase subunit epsilon
MSDVLHLTIITQEKPLLTEDVSQVTVPSADGELTILPGHIPLFTRVQVGELRYKAAQKDAKEVIVVVSNGFLDVAPNNMVTILTDSASHERDITLAQAEDAKKRAEDAMKNRTDERNFIIAEASLRKALMEIRVAQKRKNIG